MTTARLTMQDPRKQYPGPPFVEQEQPSPGLDAKMKPKPDHGEKSYIGSGKLAGRKALVTGGDSGIGRAAAIAFSREGADVAIGFLPSEESDAREVAECITGDGRKAILLPGDIRDEAFCSKLVEDAVEKLGGLDILVNNAGAQKHADSLEDVTTADFEQIMKTNVYALFWITKAAIGHLKPGSTIVNTASVQAYHPTTEVTAYAMTKAAIVAFTKSMSEQLLSKGIRINAVAPGPFWTALQPSGGQPAEKVEQFGSEVPFKRPGQPVEAAPIYVLLASQESSYTTGEIYGVTGGKGLI